MKTLIKLIIAAVVIHATWRAGTVYWNYYQFQDGLQQIAQFSGARSANELRNMAFEVAKQHDIPIQPDRIIVRREENHTLIDASYDVRIELLPRYYYPYQFKVSVDAFTIVPRRD
jgi:hypothetical protein